MNVATGPVAGNNAVFCWVGFGDMLCIWNVEIGTDGSCNADLRMLISAVDSRSDGDGAAKTTADAGIAEL